MIATKISTNTKLSPQDVQRRVAKAQRGDKIALGEVLEHFRRSVTAHISRIVRDAADASDLYQEICVKIHQNLNMYTPTHAFSTWLYKVARNTAINYLRTAKYDPCAHAELNLDDQESTKGDPVHTYEMCVLGAKIAQAVAMLPEHYQTVFLMAEEDGLNDKQIAECLEIPEGTVKSRHNRSRVILCQLLLEIDPSILKTHKLTPKRIF